ncbi:MAG TPA: SMP-30/gluconolactonase/LRE family protein [Burkholderiales bacterium]|nr:SMP-30/gluconolactonase/LRE family protein [Burkholderiales bacterium]
MRAAGSPAAPLDEPADYPEGPTVAGGALYWTEMPNDRVQRHRDGRTTTVWQEAGCGPTSIKADARGGFWILCHLGNRVLRVDGNFKALARLEQDGAGRALSSPNDAFADRRGQLYFTLSGIFHLQAPAEGAIYFVDLQDRVQRIADGLRYANGVHLDEKRARLYVSEHLQRRVLVAELAAPGKIGPLRVFFDLNATPLLRPQYPNAGPDGLLVDRTGALHIAEYGAGRVLVVSAQGQLQRSVAVPMQFVTNFAYWAERDQIVVTGAFRNDSAPMRGRVIALPH